MNYYLNVWKKYAVFTGRASRAEYWYFYLFNFLIALALTLSSYLIRDNNNILGTIYSLAVLVPNLAVLVRRLHDVGKSAWWILINLIPIVGWIWFFVLLVTDSNPGDNNYGPNPKKATSSSPISTN